MQRISTFVQAALCLEAVNLNLRAGSDQALCVVFWDDQRPSEAKLNQGKKAETNHTVPEKEDSFCLVRRLVGMAGVRTCFPTLYPAVASSAVKWGYFYTVLVSGLL